MKRNFGAISIGSNFILLGIFLFCLKSAHLPVKPERGLKIQLSSAPALVQRTNVIDATNAPVFSTKFYWRDIESEDYPTYIANLRAVHCPEKTIFDILFADIEKLFAEREKKLDVKEKFWLTGDEIDKARLAKQEKVFALHKEKRELIKTLLNSDLDWEVMQEWYKQKELGMFLAYLPDAQVERALSVAKTFSERIQEVARRADGLRIPEDAEENSRVYSEMKTALSGIISSTELDEGELRAVCIAGYIFHSKDLKECHITGPELRHITQLKAQYDNPLQHELLKFDGEDSSPEELGKQTFLGQVKNYLREVRFKQYLRANDNEFEQLCNFVEKNGLRSQIALAVFEVQSAATLESLQIKENNRLLRREMRQQLQLIEQSARDAIQQMLGAKAMANYSTNGGSWITELGKP